MGSSVKDQALFERYNCEPGETCRNFQMKLLMNSTRSDDFAYSIADTFQRRDQGATDTAGVLVGPAYSVNAATRRKEETAPPEACQRRVRVSHPAHSERPRGADFVDGIERLWEHHRRTRRLENSPSHSFILKGLCAIYFDSRATAKAGYKSNRGYFKQYSTSVLPKTSRIVYGWERFTDSHTSNSSACGGES